MTRWFTRSTAVLLGSAMLVSPVLMPSSLFADDAAAPVVQPEHKKALSLWEDYIHYLRVANLDLSTSAGKALLAMHLSSEQLLDVVDDQGTYRDYDATLQTAQRMSSKPVAQLATQIEQAIRDARLDLAREGKRIRAAIDNLDQGLRSRMMAQQQLKRAGQYAAPQLLHVLLSIEDRDRDLRPYVIDTLVSIGRPVVGPLCEALPDLPAVPKQQVAEVLARIGYPSALPYLKAESIKPDTDPQTRQVLQTAFDTIVERSGVPQSSGAAQLFQVLAEDYYHHRDGLLLASADPSQLLWTYSNSAGLVATPIPTVIYNDVMAMRAAGRALAIEPGDSPAMSLWLAANFRRQNNLPAGATDPSYGPSMRSPLFYATLAGPKLIQPVLQRALSDGDPALALDAIAALRDTAGTRNLINLQSDLQPLVAALNYPDRRVRFEAALAIGASTPRVAFSAAPRVVQVLAEAIREDGKQWALVLGDDNDTLNKLTAITKGAGDFRVLRGSSIDVAAAQVASAPGVDLIVMKLPAEEAQAAIAAARHHYKLMATPILVLAPTADAPVLGRVFASDPLVRVADAGAPVATLSSDAKAAAASAVGAAITAQQATDYASAAVSMLRDMAIESGSTFKATDAEPALLDALNDKREVVALGAAEVLARFTDPDAQRAVADASLDRRRGSGLEVKFLGTLAQSARSHGNQLSDAQVSALAELVKTARGPLADAASQVHGALSLPTAAAVEFISTKK